uniref:Uncharacterized protein n=1 Tax=viral metagenome TaxID=1070528 RepID=A0A6M3KCU8_9ZZZZ
MKVTNGDILNAVAPLNKLMEEKFPVKVSFGLAKLANKLAGPIKDVEDTRKGLINTYGQLDENGKLKTKKNDGGLEILDLTPEAEAKLNAEFAELMVQEVELVVEKVKLPEKVAATCDKCKHNMDKMLEITPSILMALDKFIEV